jgi:hypothetical protein
MHNRLPGYGICLQYTLEKRRLAGLEDTIAEPGYSVPFENF